MTDPKDIIKRLGSMTIAYFEYGSVKDAINVITALVAERDEAIRERDAALSKFAAPRGETVRVRIAVWLCQGVLDEVCILENVGSDYKPHAIVTADIPIPQPAEVAGTVEASDV
ncbi:MAG TPA: hypothetical protein PK677_11185 [Acidiphilium sp.]|nr:hypothetical protein [Acidiphilium sp.]